MAVLYSASYVRGKKLLGVLVRCLSTPLRRGVEDTQRLYVDIVLYHTRREEDEAAQVCSEQATIYNA